MVVLFSVSKKKKMTQEEMYPIVDFTSFLYYYARMRNEYRGGTGNEGETGQHVSGSKNKLNFGSESLGPRGRKSEEISDPNLIQGEKSGFGKEFNSATEGATQAILFVKREQSSERYINGIRPIAVGDNPACYFRTDEVSSAVLDESKIPRKDFVTIAREDFDSGQIARRLSPQIDPYISRGEGDFRMRSLSLYGDNAAAAPTQLFLLNEALMLRLEEARATKGAPLSSKEVLTLSLETSEGAVWKNFSHAAINDINVSYFSSPIAFTAEAGLAWFFTENKTINRAFGKAINAAAQKDTVKIKLLCSGNRLDRLQDIAEPIQGRVTEIVVTDFIAPKLSPDLILPSRVTVHAETQSLLKPLPQLPEEEKIDAIVTTYGFDSVWMPKDMRVIKKGDKWYQYTYRVKVDDWNPRREELLQSMREGRALEGAIPADYEAIFVEDAVQEIDLASHPFASYIQRAGEEGYEVNFPGGLIQTVVEAFATQLSENGIFIIGDTAGYSPHSSRVSGVAERYKMEDYQLAKEILEQEYGFDVELHKLSEFVNKQFGEGWEASATDREIDGIVNSETTRILVIRREKDSPSNSK